MRASSLLDSATLKHALSYKAQPRVRWNQGHRQHSHHLSEALLGGDSPSEHHMNLVTAPG
jgi:hypothetical protein